MTEQFLTEHSDLVDAPRAVLRVTTRKTSWSGDGHKDIDRPGIFLDSIISYERSRAYDPYPLEILTESYKVILEQQKKEITSEPEGYAKMFHDHLVKKVQENPGLYTRNMRRAVKEIL